MSGGGRNDVGHAGWLDLQYCDDFMVGGGSMINSFVDWMRFEIESWWRSWFDLLS